MSHEEHHEAPVLAPEPAAPAVLPSTSAPAALGAPDALNTGSVLALQRSAGNRSVTGFVGGAAVQRCAGGDCHCADCRSTKSAGSVNRAAGEVQAVVSAAGAPLDPAIRERMELGFGTDFNDVRVHTDGRAARSAQSLQAHAYTAGEHIAFDHGQYAPGSASGDRMLAHELAHVVQQRSGPVSGRPIGGGLALSDPSDPFERDAETTADRVMARVAVAEPTRALNRALARSAVQRAVVAIQRDADGAAGPGVQPRELPKIVTDEDIQWLEELVAEAQGGGSSPDTTAQAMFVQRAWNDCLVDKANLAAAIAATVSAVGFGIGALLAPDPTTLTKWAAVGLIAAVVAGILWIISAALALMNCLAAQANVDHEQIERLQRQVDQLRQTVEELRRLQGGGTATPAPTTPPATVP